MKIWRFLGVALVAIVGLWAVMLVHGSGQTLLATLLLMVTALAVWTYGSARTHAARYLYPAVAAALLFVIFPMVYTLGMSFTNQSSRNLVDLDRARAQLLQDWRVDSTTQRGFEVGRTGNTWQLRIQPLREGEPMLVADGLNLAQAQAAVVNLKPLATEQAAGLPPAEPVRALVDWIDALRELELRVPDGKPLRVVTMREVAETEALYEPLPDGSLRERASGTVFRPDMQSGFFTDDQGHRLQPGFVVGVGLRHYLRIFTEPKFREPFMGVFAWTVAFSALTVLGAGALGLLLACLLNWSSLQGRAVYRVVLFLPYAVPAFLSILVFKGLFNQNLGEINLVLEALFGIRPAWFSDPLLARVMLLLVNIWLGFPYMMVLCSGLIQAIPADLYEASAVVGAGPWQNFKRITLPLIMKPLAPLLISAFAFNFNNFVLISLLTGGRPDHLDSDVPAGTTDILVSYTWRIAFQDSGNQYGLAAAISTVIFVMVAVVTLLQLRLTRKADEARA